MTTKEAGEKIADLRDEIAKREEVIHHLLARLKYQLPSNDIYNEIVAEMKARLARD